MIIQMFEFWGWVQDLIDVFNGTGTSLDWQAWAMFVLQVVIFGYCANFFKSNSFPVKMVFEVLFWLDFVFSTAMFGYTAVIVFMNGNDLASLLSIIILGVFFGSDMLMAGGMVYLMKNYTPVVNEQPFGQYLLLNHNGQPMLV